MTTQLSSCETDAIRAREKRDKAIAALMEALTELVEMVKPAIQAAIDAKAK